jgi:hypothetical protein
MNGCEGIFRVIINVYSYSYSKLECQHEGDKFNLLCRSPNWQWVSINNWLQSQHHITSKARAIPDKAAAIYEIFNIWIADWLIWVRSGQFEKTHP